MIAWEGRGDDIHSQGPVAQKGGLILQAIYMTGWSPHARQQRAMERGSATVSFQDLDDYVQRGGKPDEK